MTLPLLQDIDVEGKRVLLRVDFNVPFDKQGRISDETKLQEALPTLQWLLSHGASIVILSHLGRPKNFDPSLSLKVCAVKLSALLNHPVQFAEDCIGPTVERMCKALNPGEILLLENLRFYPAEENPKADPQFAARLASLGEVYVNDAFGSAHRAHTSTAILAGFFPKNRAAGFLMQKEISHLEPLLKSPKRPFYVLIGGSKISSKLGVLKNLLERVDGIFIGGGMAFTFLESQGVPIGNSIHESTLVDEAKTFLETCKKRKVSIWLPEDLIIADKFAPDANIKVITTQQGIPSGWQGMDIGPTTLKEWQQILSEAKTIFWNGPVGVFEFPPFAEGTDTLAKTLASLEETTTVVGGGDSIAAINRLGLKNQFTHLSTGGGASLEFLEFGKLPGIEALKG